MSISPRKSFLCVLSFILLISLFSSVGFEDNNDILPVRMEYPISAAYGQDGDNTATEDVVSSEVPQQLQQDSTNNNNEGNNGNGNADPSQSDQSNGCPDIDSSADTPTYVDQDGCHYPCPSAHSNDQDITPAGCPLELSSQSSSGLSINEENPIQSRQPLQTTTNEPQQNVQTSPSQNTLVNPRINSDTASDIPNAEKTTTAPQKSFNPAGQFKPGSGQTESSVPGKSDSVARPLTPGGGNAEVEGIPAQPNTNPVTPLDPGNIPTNIPGREAFLTVYSNFTNPDPAIPIDAEICVYISSPYEIKANPYCIEGSFDGTFHAVQAPGLIGIRASSGSFDTVDTSSCEIYIYPKESKSCVVNFIKNSPFLKFKSETGAQDKQRTPIE